MHDKKGDIETSTQSSSRVAQNKNGGRQIGKQIIEGYFHQGYQNDVILEFLSVYHNITISLSTLKRRLRTYGLRSVRKEVNEQEVKDIIMR